MNTQRIKSASTLLKEELSKHDPKAAHQLIKNERLAKTKQAEGLSVVDPFDIGRRCEISAAKWPLLEAINQVLEQNQDYWPLTVRQVHYRLLAPAPLLHASKPERYSNNIKSYRAAIDICARGRIAGEIDWEAIDDETRPVDLHDGYRDVGVFFRSEIKNMFRGYWRDLLQSQPAHIEIYAEKLTVRTILQEVAQRYTMPLTIARGMSSLPPKKKLVDRYRARGKKKLIVLAVSDLDPAGDTIAEDLAKCFQRDFGVNPMKSLFGWLPDEIASEELTVYKVSLTIEQVQRYNLAPSMDAKESSPTYRAYVEKYGITDAYELEAFEPAVLAHELEEGIKKVLDIDKFNAELAVEEHDSAQILAVRNQVAEFLKGLNLS